jgi:KUP system potassium uptake protein
MQSRMVIDPRERPQTALVIGAIGVVFGDIGTSPLYALRVAFSGGLALSPTHQNILGILSLVFWSLVLIVGLKYALLVMRADNKGEGGIMALMSMVLRRAGEQSRWRRPIILTGLMGTALFFGDAMIAPAISVMSAMEGLKVVAPGLKPLVVPITLAILLALFLLQRRGSAFIGSLFSPIMILWLLVLGALGLLSILQTPAILQALHPGYALHFLMEAKAQSLTVLGAVVLAVTGAEALYADMGHFGVQPIRMGWFGFVFPTLTLNYLGQGALLMREPSAATNPFFLLGPSWSLVPLLGLATLAAIIASQAVISGAFSLAWQAVQLGYLPRLSIRHTSSGRFGQIYIPSVNWLLALSIAALVLGFGTSGRLAAAYGIAVTGTMVVTTLLAFGLLGRIWRPSAALAGVVFGVFLLIDLGFLAANSSKLTQGGWVSLAVAGLVFLLLSTWKRGRELLSKRLHDKATPLEELVSSVGHQPPPRVAGTGIYLTASRFGAPLSLLHNLAVNRVLHERVVVLTVITRDEPWVPLEHRIKIRHFGGEIYRVRIYYGYNQEPNVPDALEFCKSLGLEIELSEASFFLAREHMISTRRQGMAPWRERLFIRMAVNAENAMMFWHIPPDRVIELGLMVEL